MSNYDQIVELLDDVVGEFKQVVSDTSAIASRDETLDSYSLNKLMKANARAEAATALRRMVEGSSEEELPTVVQFVQSHAKSTLRANGGVHFSVASFWNDALNILNPKP